MLLTTILASAVVGLLIFKFILFLKVYIPNWFIVNRLPGPPALPFIGNAHQFDIRGNVFYQQLMEFSKDFRDSPVFRVWVGTVPIIICHHGESVEKVLSSTVHISKAMQYETIHPWLGTGLLTSTGAKWKQRRKMLTPAFHFKILKDFIHIFNEHARVLVNEVLQSHCGTKEAFDIFPIFTNCTLDVICETAMGKKLGSQLDPQSDYVAAINEISEIIMNRQKNPILLKDFFFNLTPTAKRHHQLVKQLHKFTNDVIAERKANFQNSNSTEGEEVEGVKRRMAFLDLLLNENLTDEDIREEVDTFMFEGHDTTAAGLSWCLYLLARNPSVQSEVRAEIDAVWPDDDELLNDHISAMPTMEKCLKEAQRMYPSVPFFGRKLENPLKLQDVDLPLDSSMLILSTSLHRHEAVFPEPEVFDPERFSSQQANGRHAYAYVPFSAGPRNCIGAKFAMMEEKVIMATVLRHFEFRSEQPPEDCKPMGELILRPGGGILVTAQRRLLDQ